VVCRLCIAGACLLNLSYGGARHFIASALALLTAGRSEDVMALTSSSSSSSRLSPFQSTEVEAFWRQLMDACRQSVAGRDIEHRAPVASDKCAAKSIADA